MNKNNYVQKGKLKTLPNELTTNHEQFLFQSTCEQDFSNRLNLASPTFATSDLNSQPPDRGALSQKQNKFNNIKMTSAEFQRVYNQKLMTQCENYKRQMTQLQEKLKFTQDKLQICQKTLDKKVQKAAKYMMLHNSSQELSKSDIYLELQVFRQDYKKSKEESENMKKQNADLHHRVNELQLIITNYTNKSEKKNKKDSDIADRLEHKHQMEIEEIKRTFEIKYKQLENQKNAKEKETNKWKEDYERLKFLKQEIEKKRQEELKAQKQVSLALQKKEEQFTEKIIAFKKQIKELSTDKQELESKLSMYQKNQQYEIEQQRTQIQKIQLDLIELQTEKKKLQSNLQVSRQQNKEILSKIEDLEAQKNKLQIQIEELMEYKVSYEEKQEKMSNRISELEQQMNETESECKEMKERFEELLENEKNKSKNQKQMIESRFQGDIEDLKKDIEEIKRMKENLECQLETEREKYSRVSIELENSYRRTEEEVKDVYRRNETTQEIPSKKTLATKTVSQLKMVENILSGILGIEDFETNKIKCMGNLNKDQYIQNIVTEMAKQAEELADIFDGLENEVESLRQHIKNKEQVISKLLKFTPHEKKNQILEYLNVMEKIDSYTTEQVYKATRDIEEEANDWKKHLNFLVSTLDKYEEELQYTRKMMNKGRQPLRQYNANQQRYPEKYDMQQRRRFCPY